MVGRWQEGQEVTVSTTLEITLPWGRYHATRWGRNVNEATVDWPPSPWRLLRALYATWCWHAEDDLDATVVERLLEQLSVPPRFALPPHTVAHTRHYFPRLSHRLGVNSDTDKTLDTFVVTDRGATVLVDWPVDLDADGREALALLAERLGYLGRADSIVVARLREADDELPAEGWLEPDAGSGPTVDSLAVAETFVLADLLKSPSQVRSERLLLPAGSRFVQYPSPRPTAITRPVATRRVATVDPRGDRPVAVRFAITANALPARTQALVVGDLLHKVVTRRDDATSSLLRGTDSDRKPLNGPHDHAHLLSFSRAADDKLLDTVALWVPGGTPEDLDQLLNRPIVLFSPPHLGVERRLHLTVEAVGDPARVIPELVGPSRVWCSATPYAPVRHSRHADLDTLLQDDITRELGYRGLREAVRVAVIPGPWLTFRRHRTSERLVQARRAFGVEIEFAKPVSGPIALGQLSHFGLGLFRPAGDR